MKDLRLLEFFLGETIPIVIAVPFVDQATSLSLPVLPTLPKSLTFPLSFGNENMSMVTAFEQISNSLDIQLSLGVEEQRRVALKLLEGMHAAPAGLGLALRLGKLRFGCDVIVSEILEARNPAGASVRQ